MDTQAVTVRLRALQSRLAALDPAAVAELEHLCDEIAAPASSFSGSTASAAPPKLLAATSPAPSVRPEALGKYGLCSAAAMLRKRAKAATYQAGIVPPVVAAAYTAAADALSRALQDPTIVR